MSSTKVAFLTGSTSGIGLAIARVLAKKGFDIILTGFGEPGHIQSLKDEFTNQYKVKVDYVYADLAEVDEIKTMCQEVIKLYPEGVDILVNNAGFNHVCTIEDFPDDVWDDMVAVMLTAPFHLMKFFVPFMKKKKWGRIISTGSVHSMIASPEKTCYSAVKHGIAGLTKAVALETVEHGITCNTVCPGFVDTDIVQKQVRKYAEKHELDYEEAKVEFVAERQPSKKFVTVEQVAELVAYLCSPAADPITGSSITIDGGFTSL